MTGFGRADAVAGRFALVWELRSVNGRGLDIRLRLPSGLDRLEPPARAAIKARFARGSVTASFSLNEAETGPGDLAIDQVRLRALAEAGSDLIDEGLAAPARLDGLLALKGVVATSDPEPDAAEIEALDKAALAALGPALDALERARQAEGYALKTLLLDQIAEIAALRDQAASLAAAQPEAIRARIAAKFEELLPRGLDPERLVLEAAALAVKADVREELDRLTAHIDRAHALMEGGSPAGRPLDFLIQEFAREANTLCSKSADPALTDIGLALKARIDQVREQVQNVE